MSSTTIKGVRPGEMAEDLVELRNSHGSAPVVWSQMLVTYLGTKEHAWLWDSDRLWPLNKRLDIPLHHRAVLTITYDNAVVLQKDYARAAADIRAWLVDFPVDAERINHWPEIAALFESAPDVPGIGFHMTSVTEDPFLGPWDEETEEYGLPDFSRFWSVYDHLAKFTAPQ